MISNYESYFNVLLIVRDKVTRLCPQTTTFYEKGESKRIRTEVPLLTSQPRAARYVFSIYASCMLSSPPAMMMCVCGRKAKCLLTYLLTY